MDVSFEHPSPITFERSGS